MSEQKSSLATLKKTAGRNVKDLLDEVLNFGPDSHPLSPDASERIKRLVEQLEEINARIEKLSTEI